jgi:hypothetical protein
MGWIGVAPPGNMTPRESGLTSVWSCITREFDQPPEERKQMTVVATLLVHSPAGCRCGGSKRVW